MAETKRKGQVAEVAIMADALARGYRVSIPFGEDSPYDLVVERAGRLERVQCKYAKSDGRVVVVRCQCTNTWITTRYTVADIDWIATYDVTTARCYYVPASLLGEDGRSVVSLRLEPTANNQRIRVRWARDFTDW